MASRSTFGAQPASTKKNAPAFGFGASTREQAGKLFVSQEHTALATAGMHSPGPAVYSLPSSVGGKQPDARKRDPPVWSMGKAQRFPKGSKGDTVPGPGGYKSPAASVGPQVLARFKSEPLASFGTAERKHMRKVFYSQEHQKVDMHGMESPGPATYGLPATVGGAQVDSKLKSGPQWGFSTYERGADAELKNAARQPGPANYSLPQSVGPQPDSKKVRAPTPGFGASTRDQRAKIFLGADHEKGSFGMQSPGPAAGYQLNAAIGKQAHS
jgi:hypothetical protein